MLSAFRSGFGCQTALLKIVEDWKRALDDNKYIAAISMDLSKAFDCLPHNLLLLKLEAYGLTKQSLNLLKNYLKEREQTAGKPATQESSLDVFCHVIFDVNIDVMDVRGRPQEFVAL